MKRKSAAAIGLLLILTACGGEGTVPGDGTSRTPPGYSSDADQVVLQIATGGGFVPLQYNLAQFPEWTLYGDGALLTRGPQIEIYPAPALPSVQVQHLTREGIEQILIAAAETGLTSGDAEYTTTMVTDMPTTVITTTADDRTSRVAAYALGFDDQSGTVPAAERAARAKIDAFVENLSNLQAWLPEGSVTQPEVYEPSALRVYTLPPVKAQDPALEQPNIEWPLSTPMGSFGASYGDMPDTRCGVVEGSELQKMLEAAQGANQLTTWTDGKDRALLVLRPELPGETGCQEG